MKIVVSACLLGHNCKYNGGNNFDEKVMAFLQGKEVIPVCPEVLAGLGVPRTPIEIVNGVLQDREGNSVDGALRQAVEEILEQLQQNGMRGRRVRACGRFAAVLFFVIVMLKTPAVSSVGSDKYT